MRFVRGLFHISDQLRNKCGHVIRIPPAVRIETVRSQFAWPWGTESRNFACLQCTRVFEYSATNCRWSPIDSDVLLETLEKAAIYELTVPCGEEECSWPIRVLLVANRESAPVEASELVLRLWGTAIRCEGGHRRVLAVAYKPWKHIRMLDGFGLP